MNTSIENAEKLRDNIVRRLEWMKTQEHVMDKASWIRQEGFLISGNDAEMFLGLLIEWIETTKELIVGPLTAADVNESNAARVQTRMKYKFVQIPGERKVVCVPKEEFDAARKDHADEVEAATTGELPQGCHRSSHINIMTRLADITFYMQMQEYPVVLHIDL